MANATVFRGSQVGVESSKGTEVDAEIRLLATTIMLDPRKPKRKFRPQGSKANTTTIGQKEFTEGEFEGPLTYRDIAYLLSGAVEQAAIATPTGATLTRRWTWLPANFAPDDYVTYSIEIGYDGFVERTKYGLINGLTIDWTREGVDLSGDILAQVFEDSGGSIDTVNTTIEELPADPDEGSIFVGGALTNNVWVLDMGDATAGTFTLTFTSRIDGSSFTTAAQAFNELTANLLADIVALANIQADDVTVTGSDGGPWTITFPTAGRYGAIGMTVTADFSGLTQSTTSLTQTVAAGLTKLNFPLTAQFSMPNRFAGEFTLCAVEPSWTREVELGMDDLSAQLILEADSVGVGFMDELRDNDTLFCKWVFLGPIIELDFSYRFDLTFAFKFDEPGDRDDQDGVWGIEYNLVPIYNSALGSWARFQLDTNLTSL